MDLPPVDSSLSAWPAALFYPVEDSSHASPQASLSMKLVATVIFIYFVRWAEPVLMPITVAFLLALTLRPFVRRSRKWGIPVSVSAAAFLGLIVVAGLASVTVVLKPARQWAETAPAQFQRIEEKLASFREQWALISSTSAKVKEMAQGGKDNAPMAVELAESPLLQPLSIATNTGNAFGTCLVVVVLSFFILTSGDQLLNQVLTGLTRLSEKKRTVELVREVERGIAMYLSTVTVINAGLGIVSGIGFWLLGLPNPAVWGAMTFLFNYVPFFGPVACTLIVTFVSLLTYDSAIQACVAPLFFVAVAAVEGNLLTPMIVGRSMSLNPIIVFIALILGGWAWGLGGAILAVPLLAVVKIACDKFATTQSIGRLLNG